MRRTSLFFLLTTIAAPAFASSPAQQAMDAYQSCWAKVVSTLSIDKPGKLKDREAERLMHEADKVCGPQSDDAARLNSLHAVKDIRQYMAVQFYNANFQTDAK